MTFFTLLSMSNRPSISHQQINENNNCRPLFPRFCFTLYKWWWVGESGHVQYLIIGIWFWWKCSLGGPPLTTTAALCYWRLSDLFFRWLGRGRVKEYGLSVGDKWKAACKEQGIVDRGWWIVWVSQGYENDMQWGCEEKEVEGAMYKWPADGDAMHYGA